MDRTAQKALRMLELLSASEAPRGVSELARALSLPKSNIHRLLTTLEAEGYVRRTPERSYVLTFKLWQLGARMMSRLDVRSIAPAHMQRLAKAAGESVLLGVLDGFDVVYIDKVEAEQAIRATTTIGSRVPAHCVSTGKALLSLQPPEFITQLMRHAKAYTSATAHTQQKLAKQLQEARQQGYAVNRQEFRDGVSGIGAAIMDSGGNAVAAIGVWGPDARIVANLKMLARQVTVSADAISHDLGFLGARASEKPSQRAPKHVKSRS
jgi:DNA-binding IclR family transcriptional regulator